MKAHNLFLSLLLTIMTITLHGDIPFDKATFVMPPNKRPISLRSAQLTHIDTIKTTCTTGDLPTGKVLGTYINPNYVPFSDDKFKPGSPSPLCIMYRSSSLASVV